MDKLQEIKNGWESASYVTREETEWLIEQAEKVDELKKINRKLNHEIGSYSGKLGSIAEKLLLLEKEMLMS